MIDRVSAQVLWQTQAHLTFLENRDNTSTTLAFSRDGRWLASGSRVETKVFEPRGGRLVQTLPGGLGAFAHGKPLIAILVENQTRVELWDTDSFQQVTSLRRREQPAPRLLSLAFDVADICILAGEEHGNVLRWHLPSENLATFQVAGNAVYSLDTSFANAQQSDKLIATTARLGKAHVLQFDTLFMSGGPYHIGNDGWCVRLLPDGSGVVTAGDSGEIVVGERESAQFPRCIARYGPPLAPRPIVRNLPHTRDYIALRNGSLTWADDLGKESVGNRQVAPLDASCITSSLTGDRILIASSKVCTIVPRSFDNSDPAPEGFGLPEECDVQARHHAAFADGGRSILAAAASHVWKLHATDGRVTQQSPPASGRLLTLAVSPTEQEIAVGDSQGRVHFLDESLRRWTASHHLTASSIRQLLYTPDGMTLVVLTEDQGIMLFDTDSRRVNHVWQRSAQEIAISPDGRTLAAAGDEQLVRLWNLQSNRELGQLTVGSGRTDSGGHYTISSLDFSDDGERLIAALVRGNFEERLLVWDAPRK